MNSVNAQSPNPAPNSVPQPVSTPPPLALNPGAMPGEAHVRSLLQRDPNESPLDYIKRNTRSTTPDVVAQPSPSPAPTQEAAPVPPVQTPPPAEEPKQEVQAPVDVPDPELQEIEKGSVAENFKRLKAKYKETKQLAEAHNRELEETRGKLKKYETGEILPDALKEQQNRIARLEKFEKIYDLESSPEYHKKTQKLSEVKGKLGQYAEEYGIPVNELEKTLDMGVAEKNRFLSEHFDEFGGMEVNRLLEEAKSVKTWMSEAKKEPESVLSQLIKDGEAARAAEVAASKQRISTKTTNSWERSLHRIKQDGWAPELIYRDNDSEHNEKIVKPILSKAAEEHGKIISALAEAGLSDLSDELSDALAKQTLLAHASAVAIETRNAAIKAYNELEENTKRTNGFIRPSVGGHFGGGSGDRSNGTKEPLTPESAAKALREKFFRT